jgi:hypothetical protein
MREAASASAITVAFLERETLGTTTATTAPT